jgi:amino acid adenylation domain-containing protein
LVSEGCTNLPMPIEPAPRDVAMPLSFAQQRLWFLEQLEPERCSYNMAAALRLQGHLNAEALQHSLDQIVERHEALRTYFPSEGGRPVQKFAIAASCHLSHVDLSDLPTEQQQKALARYAKLEETTPFELETGPVIRASLLRCADDDWVLLLTMHHIVSDGWSISILTRELTEFYSALIEERPADVPKLPVQYADFACWQREELAAEAMSGQLDYWREELKGLLPSRLPVDRPAPEKRTFQGATAVRQLAPLLCERIDKLSRQENTTQFMTLMAAFQVLLARWSGESDITVGTPIANRNREDVEGLIGFFVNSLVMRADLSDNPSFLELLARTRDTALEAFANQDLPFEKLVEELSPERNLTQNPLFQVMFAVQNATTIEFAFPELTMSVLEFDLTATRFDLEIQVWAEDNGLSVCAFYDTELFDKETIQQLLARYEHLLVSIVTSPGDLVAALPLLPAMEEDVLLRQWNLISQVDEPTQCLHELFAVKAREHADDIAIVDEAVKMSYRELDQRANALAFELREAGTDFETLVPFCCHRGAEAIVAILGILKAGGAYVPIDAQWPQDRIDRILAQMNHSLLVTDHQVGIRNDLGFNRIVLDCSLPLASSNCDHTPHLVSSPDHLAYVIYTSGSSGQPKGVQVSHQNVARLFQQASRLFEFQHDDVWSVFHAFAFDFSVWEIWGALLNGAKLVVVPELPRRSPSDFIEFLEQHSITILSQTPTAFSQLVSVENPHEFADRLSLLRYVILGGESLDPQLLRPWLTAFGDDSPQVINMYGITETTIHVTFQQMKWEHLYERASGSLIGRRLDDLQIYLLDDNMNPVPQGSVGEIYVGGAGLARGYLGDPLLTARRFVPHPWGPSGTRLYRTGDLARFRGPEVLEYWGRVDHQIKLRGFRIEPAEIENCLRSHPKVSDAIVTLHQQHDGDAWLVAHVTKPADVNIDESELSGELHRHARSHLPEQMLPRSYTLLTKLPRTSNGKADRTSLPAPTGMRPELSDSYVAPRTETERGLTTIWEEIMKLDRVGMHDSFFELGGHSLLATQVISRIRDRFGVALPLRALFESPRISELAIWITESDSATQDDDTPKNQASRRQAALQRLRTQRKPKE